MKLSKAQEELLLFAAEGRLIHFRNATSPTLDRIMIDHSPGWSVARASTLDKLVELGLLPAIQEERGATGPQTIHPTDAGRDLAEELWNES